MSESLRDQLLKSGLVKPPQKADKPKRKAVRKRAAMQNAKPARQHSEKTSEPDLAKAYALRARQEQRERDKAKAEAERIARERKERKRRLQVLLDGKALNADDADLPRHFPHRNRIRRIYCTREQLGRLNRGDLAVVQLGGRFLLVIRDLALQAQQIDPDSMVLLCDSGATNDDDVPDDLVW